MAHGTTPRAPVEGGFQTNGSRRGRWQTSKDFRALLFSAAWSSVNFLLLAAIVLVAYSAAWEYSTCRYLKGFADAIIPESASSEAKTEAILNWLSYGPGRQNADDEDSPSSDRDPTRILNYTKLLRTCGTATNAFLNLARAGGLSARRLLLLDSHHLTKHVVAEVYIDGRWIVVDPVFRRILRAGDGRPLTREELAEPIVLSAATRNIRGYDPSYTYESTAHLRLARLDWIGQPLEAALNRFIPEWEDSGALSLLLERESLAVLVGSIVLALVFCAARSALRWYGRTYLQIHAVHFIDRVCQSAIVSLTSAPLSRARW